MRRNRIFAGALALFLALVLLSPVFASSANKWRAYDPGAFSESRKAGKTVIVSVHADW
jgi:hypothetical protein